MNVAISRFLISEEQAKGPGFGLFSGSHLMVLFLLAVLATLVIRHYKKADIMEQEKLRKRIAIIILNLECWKDVALLLTGQFTSGNLPFQLCGLGIFFVTLDAWWPSHFSRGLLYSLTLWGAIMALVFPNWVASPLLNLFVWQSFAIHTLLVTYVLMQLIAGNFRPQFRDLRGVIIFLIIALPLLMLLNRLPDSPNFFFLRNPVAGSPLALIHAFFGDFYLIGLVSMLVILWFFLYLPWAFLAHWRNK